MPIFRIQDKLVLFLHIPKAGGTSVEKWLSDMGSESFRQHRRMRGIPCVPQHFHGVLIDSFFASGFFDYSFAVTRNPYWRLLSEYNYRMSHRKFVARLFPIPSFPLWTRFVLWRYATKPYIYSNHIRPQVEFRIAGTEVFRLEDQLPALYRRISEVCNLKVNMELPVANRSQSRETRVDDRTARAIYNFYRDDFEQFGYRQDSFLSPDI